EPRAFRHPETAVENDPPVRGDAVDPEAPRQARVVEDDRAGSDQDGVVLLAQEEGALPRFRPRDPAAPASDLRRFAVERRGPLGGHERPPLPDPDAKLLVLALRPPPPRRARVEHGNSAARKRREAAPSDERVRIPRRGHHAPD